MTMEEANAQGLHKSTRQAWHIAAKRLGLGRIVTITTLEPRGKSKRRRNFAMRLFTDEELETIKKYLAQNAGRANSGRPTVSQHAAQRALEWTEQLIAEGENPSIASARARAAYGLQEDAPAGNPQPSDAMRREWLMAAATARKCLLSAEGHGRSTSESSR